jgi:hypothetical protein
MTTMDKRAEDRQALERLLEVYGAERTRWPARERLRFAGFIAEDEAAKRLVSEASALDALLDLAPRASEAHERALQERIVAAALRSSETKFAVVGGGGAAPQFSLRSRLSSLTSGFGKAPAGREWPAAALLAASLALGVFLGSAGTFDSTVQRVADVAGLSASTDTSQLARGEDIVAVADEDLL